MRIGFVSLPVPGHLNPMTTLARKLQSRGHDVVFISLADVAPFVEAAGLPFVPCSEAAYPAGSLGKLVRRLSELSGEDALHFTVNSMMKGYTKSLFESLPDTLSKAGVDGIVLDQYQPYVELIPMHLRMPFVHVSNALHVDYTGRTPICFVDWPYKTGVDARARNIEGVRRARILLEPVTAVAQAYAREVGLSVDWNNPHATLSPLAWVTQCPREFDFGCAPDFPQFQYAGPFHDGRGRLRFDGYATEWIDRHFSFDHASCDWIEGITVCPCCWWPARFETARSRSCECDGSELRAPNRHPPTQFSVYHSRGIEHCA